MFVGIIYKYTSPSGKVYIGQTRNEQSRRQRWFNEELPYAGPKINAARKKYGATNFRYNVIFEIKTEDEYILMTTLNNKEKEYIQIYDSITNGYNLSEGGITVVLTEDQKQRAGDSHKKPILLYDIYGNFVREYKSSEEAARDLHISSGNISNVLKGRIKQINDYIFLPKVSDDYPKLIDTSNRKTYNRKRIGKYSLNGELLEVYRSIAQAAKLNSIDRNWLAQFVKGKDNHVFRNFIWKEIL